MKVPGLVDLQVNGYKGVDFSAADLTEEEFVRAADELFEAGTTAFLPTAITSPLEVYERNLSLIAKVIDMPQFKGRLLGIHIEGPFISPVDGARGAHNAEWVRQPDIALLDKLIEWADGKVRLLTIAAELKGAEELARHAVKNGIAVSLGHQMADEDDITRLADAGATALTHLGNGVPAMLPRHDNPIWAGLAEDRLAATIITDSHHLPVSVVKTFIRTKGADRCIVISDVSPPAGLEPGRHRSCGQDVVLERNGRLYNPATGYLAGSSATMLECMNHLASLDLVSPDELVAVGFGNPLRLIGLTPQGVAPGPDIFYDPQRRVFGLEG